MTLPNRARILFQDHPAAVNLGILLAVVAQAVSTVGSGTLDLPTRIIEHSRPEAISAFAVEAAAVAGVVAGFAGVLVIFGLGTDSARFRILRQRGGGRLLANWTSVVAVSLLGAFAFVGSGLLVLADSKWLGLWLTEFAVLVTAHGAVRLVWLLRALASVVAGQDGDDAAENSIDVDDVFGTDANSAAQD